MDNDRLWREARVPLERRKRTSRDIILPCPQGFWGRIGKYRRGEADTVGTASGNAYAFKVVCLCLTVGCELTVCVHYECVLVPSCL